jgi:hypothetical protein
MSEDIVVKLRRDATCSSHKQAADEIELLRQVCARLSRDLSTAQTDILPWIEKAQHLIATNMEQAAALRRIGMPGKDIGYCRDGHEIAVLIARDALKESKA